MNTTKSTDIDDELARFEAEERARLGLGAAPVEHWRDEMTSPVFTAKQRKATTLLVGGLTLAHNTFIVGALEGIGYKVRALDCPDTGALRHGKEFGNRGQCNPTYFTVGSLVQELCRLRDEEGLSSDEVIERFCFVTAGACGPCRFGMYVTEYRKALRDAGFDGFRVLLFEQTGGLKQATGEELGLVLNPTFFMALARALFIGDVINLMAYRLRPYEVNEGDVNRAMDAVKGEVYQALATYKSVLPALWRGRRILSRLELDRTKVHAKVAIIGEFWAMTTEGDGNYHLQEFLESEGAEVQIQVLANTLLYNLWEFRHDTLARVNLRGADKSKFGLADSDLGLTMAGLWLGEMALRGTWQTFATILGLTDHVLPNMDEIAAAGDNHYNVELRGGEGHLEVAKLILNVLHQKAHMTLSVKPFGCMPSSGVSDGVQSMITEMYPDAIFCPVETSGDGAVNFYSRVQMFLFKAKLRAQAEFEAVCEEEGVTPEQVRNFARGTRYSRFRFLPPHRQAGSAADFVHYVGPLAKAGLIQRSKIHTQRALAAVKHELLVATPERVRGFADIAPYLPALVRFGAVQAKDAVPSWNSLLERFIGQTEADRQDVLRAEAALESAPAPSVEPQRTLHVVA